MEAISAIAAYQQAGAISGSSAAPSPTVPAADFGDKLVTAITNVEIQHASAETALSQLASGEVVDLHGTMIELEKADIALRTLVSVRDRFISAYEQVMNMSV